MKLTAEKAMEHFTATFKKSAEMTQACKEYIPGGFSRRTFMYGPFALYVDYCDGPYIHTIDGQKLLDLNNNFTVTMLGYRNEAVDKAIIDTMKLGYSIGNPTMEEVELAKMLIDRIPSMEKVKFFCSASEACMGALRTIRAYTGKVKYAKMEGGYHGFIDPFAISAHAHADPAYGTADAPIAVADEGAIPESRLDEVIILTQNDYEGTEKILREHADELAGVILEPMAVAGGIVKLEKDYLQMLRDLTKELGMVLVFDETIMIRQSRGGYQEFIGITPDLTITGKTIGGGLPIGALGGSKEVMAVFEDGRTGISGTHHGHRLACAAGVALLKQMDDDAYAYLNGIGDRVKNELNAWAEANKYPFYVDGEGSVLMYTFTKEVGQRIKTQRDFWSYQDEDMMGIFSLEIATRGYLPVHRGQLAMTLAMTEENVTGFIETTKAIIEEMFE